MPGPLLFRDQARTTQILAGATALADAVRVTACWSRASRAFRCSATTHDRHAALPRGEGAGLRSARAIDAMKRGCYGACALCRRAIAIEHLRWSPDTVVCDACEREVRPDLERPVWADPRATQAGE